MSEGTNADRSVAGDLEHNGFAVVQDLMDSSLIDGVGQTIPDFAEHMAYFTAQTAKVAPRCPWTVLPWGSECDQVVRDFEQKKPQIDGLKSQKHSSVFVHFHPKEKEALSAKRKSSSIDVLIPIRLDAGYPRCVKGESAVEIPLTLGSVLIWNTTAFMVFPPVQNFENGGGFAIILSY